MLSHSITICLSVMNLYDMLSNHLNLNRRNDGVDLTIGVQSEQRARESNQRISDSSNLKQVVFNNISNSTRNNVIACD